MQRPNTSGGACKTLLFAAAATVLSAVMATPVRADDTGYIQGLIDSAAANGGQASVPAGTYNVGSLSMKSGVTLTVPAGCVINMAGTFEASNVSNIGIQGQGTLNEVSPAYAVELRNVTGFTVSGITINGYVAGAKGYGDHNNGGYWTCPCWSCTNGTWNGVTINSDKIQWTDGIDLSNCNYIAVSRCKISAGDDGVSVKAYSKSVAPTGSSYITVTDCTFDQVAVGMPMGIGSETYQPIHNITFANNKVLAIDGAPYKLWVARSFEKDPIAGASGDPPSSVYDIYYSNNTGCGAESWSAISLQGDVDWPFGVYFDGMAVSSLTSTSGAKVTLQPGDMPALLPGGTYQLTPQCAPGSRMSDLGWKTAAGSPIGIYAADNNNDQFWTFTRNGDGTYKIASVSAPGMVLDDAGSGSADGNPIQLYNDTGASSQEWLLMPIVGGYMLSPRCAPAERLDDTGSGTTNGNPLQIYHVTGLGSQVWSVTTTGGAPEIAGGLYTIANRYSGLLLDDPNGGGAGTNLDQRSLSRTDQLWRIAWAGGGYYTISPDANNGLAATGQGSGSSLSLGAPGSNSGLWSFGASGTAYAIANRASGLMITDLGWNLSEGGSIGLWTEDDNQDEQWTLEYLGP